MSAAFWITLAGMIVFGLIWLAAAVIHSSCRALGEGVTGLPIPDDTGQFSPV